MKFHLFHGRRRQPLTPLRVEGIGAAPMTPAPDDAETAAQALLDRLSGNEASMSQDDEPEKGTREYYQYMSRRIRKAHGAAALRAMRVVTFCEQEVKKPVLPKEGDGALSMLDAGLMRHIDAVERAGGDLERRWQHCMALITLRQMKNLQTNTTNE